MHYSDIDVSCLHTPDNKEHTRSVVSDYKDCEVKHNSVHVNKVAFSNKSDDNESHPLSAEILLSDCKSFCFSDETDSHECEEEKLKREVVRKYKS